MKIEVEEVRKLEEGKHKGVITDVQYRTEPYNYTDVCIEINNATWTVGYPTALTKDSKLGKLMQRFGQRFKVGDMVDPNVVLAGRQCTLVSIMEASKKDPSKVYSKIISSSVKPLAEEQQTAVKTDKAGMVIDMTNE